MRRGSANAAAPRPIDGGTSSETRRARVERQLTKDEDELGQLIVSRDTKYVLASAIAAGIPVIGAVGGAIIARDRALHGQWWTRRELLASAAGYIGAFGLGGYGVGVAATNFERQARKLEPRITMLAERIADMREELSLTD